jgi:hypothetical protein
MKDAPQISPSRQTLMDQCVPSSLRASVESTPGSKKIHGPFPEVDVMITFFCDFRKFSAKKLSFFIINLGYEQIFAEFSFVLSQKPTIWRKYF